MPKTTVEQRHVEPGFMGRWPFFELADVLRWPDALVSTLHELPMRIEQYHEDGMLVVRAELPGVDPEKDVTIEVLEGTLRIHAERRQETKTEERDVFRSELHYGGYYRSIPLPAGASEKDVKAVYKDGILEVRVPVHEAQAKGRRVPIAHD